MLSLVGIFIIDTVESEPKPRQTKVGEQIASYVEFSNLTCIRKTTLRSAISKQQHFNIITVIIYSC